MFWSWELNDQQNSSSCLCSLKLHRCCFKSCDIAFSQEDIFSFNCVNLGPLSKVKVWHDNSGLKSAWHLDRIEIQDKLAEENYVFPCNRWLATSEDDGQICRELVVVDERARKLERRRTLSRKASVISNVDGVDLEAKGLLLFLSVWMAFTKLSAMFSEKDYWRVKLNELTENRDC